MGQHFKNRVEKSVGEHKVPPPSFEKYKSIFIFPSSNLCVKADAVITMTLMFRDVIMKTHAARYLIVSHYKAKSLGHSSL